MNLGAELLKREGGFDMPKGRKSKPIDAIEQCGSNIGTHVPTPFVVRACDVFWGRGTVLRGEIGEFVWLASEEITSLRGVKNHLCKRLQDARASRHEHVVERRCSTQLPSPP